MKVPFNDIKRQYLYDEEKFIDTIKETLNSGIYVLGSEVCEFEENFAAFCNVNYCIGVGNGLDALTLLLRAHNLPVGSDVLIPENTFVATVISVLAAGLNPVLVPVDKYHNICIKTLEALVTSNTSAVIAVHLYGQPAEMSKLRQISKTYELFLFEDAAQAHGASEFDVPVGSNSDGAAFSFYPGKNLGAFGDAGAICVNDKKIAEMCLSLRSYGSSQKYKHDVIGVNSRIDPIQASILNVKIGMFADMDSQRSHIAGLYNQHIINEFVEKPFIRPGVKHSWHLYVIQCESRDTLQKYLFEKGIDTLIHYPLPIFEQYAFKNIDTRGLDKCLSRKRCASILSLPIFPYMRDDEAMYVIDTINQYNA